MIDKSYYNELSQRNMILQDEVECIRSEIFKLKVILICICLNNGRIIMISHDVSSVYRRSIHI